MGPLSDLADEARRGDPGATAALVRAIWPDAYRIAWSILQNRPDAEDAAQDACARLLSAIGTLREPARFNVWFYRIVVNAARQKLRDAARRREIVKDENEERISVEDRVDVRRAIESLDPAQRVVVVLRYYYDLNSSQIGEILATSPITVRWRLMRAHSRLRALLRTEATIGECLDEQLASR
jgi:RNA polymerase sigma-70 factor, ECF subfamily